jgi:hypothetical protein
MLQVLCLLAAASIDETGHDDHNWKAIAPIDATTACPACAVLSDKLYSMVIIAAPHQSRKESEVMEVRSNM